MSYLSQCGARGGYIGGTTRAEEFRGLDLIQVERAVSALMRRKIIRKEGIRYIINNNDAGA